MKFKHDVKYNINFNTHCVHARINPVAFREPDTEYFPVYSWIWHTGINKDEICQQLDSMYSRNIKNLYIIAESVHFRPNLAPTMLEPDYYTDGYLKLWHDAVSYAASKGMNFWLYDEDGWPSGSAGHAVVRENPELEQKRLIRTEIKLKAGETYNLEERCSDGFMAALSGGKRIAGRYTADGGTDRLEGNKPDNTCGNAGDNAHDNTHDNTRDNVIITEYRLEPAKQHVGYPDILDPKATAEFIRLTHERVKAEMGEHIGGALKIAFTDEPATGKLGFNEEFIKAFNGRYGYDICDYLPALFDAQDIGDDEIKARQDYYELVSEILADNYFTVLRKWCAHNGMLSSGHLGGENDTLGCVNGSSGFYQPLRMLRCFDIPGVDAIWRQIFPKPAECINGKTIGENNFFPRYASSAANQIGSNTSVTESYAVYGAGLTYGQMRYVQNYQFVRGINLLNVMNMTYKHVDFLMGGIRPSFPEQMPGAADVAAYNLHSARLTYLMTAGKPCADTALYMPFRDFRADLANSKRVADEFEKIGFAIERAQGSFDVIDDDLLLNVSEEDLKEGVLRSGYAEYRTVFMPHCLYMPDEVRQRLEMFIRGGGAVHEFGGCSNALEQLSSVVKPVVRSSSDKIRSIKRITEDGELYFLYNEGFEPIVTDIELPYAKVVKDLTAMRKTFVLYEFDTVTGEIRIPLHTVGGGGIKISLHLHSGEGRCYLLANHDFDSGNCHERKKREVLCNISKFTFRRIREFIIGEHRYESKPVCEEPCEAEPGRWPAPDDCSGDAV